MFQAHPPLLLAALCLTLAVPAAATTPYNHGDATPHEQLLLELVNRAVPTRPPKPPATALPISMTGLAAGTITTDPKPPLAINPFLLLSARSHSQWMVDTDTFSHTGAGGTSSKERMIAAGYLLGGFWGTGGKHRRGLEHRPPGSHRHRQRATTRDFSSARATARTCSTRNTMRPALASGPACGSRVGVTYPYGSLATQNFAYSGSSPSPDGPFITGVVYQDLDGDNFYTPGEGVSGVTITPSAGAYHAVTSGSGGYSIPVGSAAGTSILTFTGGPFTGHQQDSHAARRQKRESRCARRQTAPCPVAQSVRQHGDHDHADDRSRHPLFHGRQPSRPLPRQPTIP